MKDDWIVALPIVGLKSNILPARIGPIEFIRLNTDFVPNESKNIGRIAIAFAGFGQPNGEVNIKEIEFLEDALAILRLFIYRKFQHGYASLNLISRRKVWEYSDMCYLNKTNSSKSINVDLRPGGRDYDYRLTKEDLDKFESNHLAKLLDLLLKLYQGDKLTELDNVIVKTVTWAGMMLEDTFYRDRFLRGVTSLETLFQKHKTKGISKKFRELGAKLYLINPHNTKDEVSNEDRFMLIEKKLKYIYKARCSITHTGEMDGLENLSSFGEFENLICNICFNSIILWVNSINISDFYGWLEYEK